MGAASGAAASFAAAAATSASSSATGSAAALAGAPTPQPPQPPQPSSLGQPMQELLPEQEQEAAAAARMEALIDIQHATADKLASLAHAVEEASVAPGVNEEAAAHLVGGQG